MFLAHHHFLVGLSLDGPAPIHDHYRTFASGRGSYDKVMATANLLKRQQVAFNILAMLTDRNIRRANDLYRFFRSKGFSHLQFIPCYQRHPQTGELLGYSVSGEALGAFYCDLFDLWMKDGFYEMSIREFEEILIYAIDGVHTACNRFDRCLSYLVVEHNGDVYPCDFYVYPEWKLGNIVAQPADEVLNSPVWQRFSKRKSLLPQACKSCRWLAYCQGDCPRYRSDGAEDSPDGGAFCAALKTLLEHIEPHLDTIRKRAMEVRGTIQQTTRPGPARNHACACGSGRKYKHCCGRGSGNRGL